MEMQINFPGGKRVDANFDKFVVQTDQPVSGGGESAAPTPFQLFLASIGTCAGIFVLGFCQSRNLPTDGIRLVQSSETDPETHRLTSVKIAIEVPASFPEKYHEALVRVAEKCAVKRAIQDPPAMTVETRVTGT